MNLREENKAINYITQLFSPEDDVLKAARESIPDDIKHMCLSASEAQILAVLIRLGGYKKIIEVGTLAGYTSIIMARAADKNAAGQEAAQIITLEKSAENAAMASKNIKLSDVAKNIKLIQGDAHATLADLASDAPYDAIFIDADKSGYPKYLDWAEQNIRKGGLIIGDNTFLFGEVFEGVPQNPRYKNMHAAMREFNSRLADKSKYTSIIIPTLEGLTIAVKEF
jgi:caffeoyl-CoA O-methyltransferase